MKKQINRYSLNKYFKKLEIETERKTPKDIKAILKTFRYSESLKSPICIGDMTLEHFVRSLLKDNQFWLDAYLSKKKEIRQLKKDIRFMRLLND